jgi:hypothetical protein
MTSSLTSKTSPWAHSMHHSSVGRTAAEEATGRHVDLPCRRGGLCFTYAPPRARRTIIAGLGRTRR